MLLDAQHLELDKVFFAKLDKTHSAIFVSKLFLEDRAKLVSGAVSQSKLYK